MTLSFTKVGDTYISSEITGSAGGVNIQVNVEERALVEVQQTLDSTNGWATFFKGICQGICMFTVPAPCTDMTIRVLSNVEPTSGDYIVSDGFPPTPIPTSYRQFKSSWHTNTTLLEFCQDVVNDTDVQVGDLFMGQLSCTGLPEGMSNGEVTVQVNQGISGKLLLLTMTSTNLAPYHWEQSFYNDTLYGWKSFDENGTASTLVAEEALRTNNYAAIVALASDPNAGTTTVTTNPEWKLVYTDADERILLGKRQDDTWYFAADLDDILDTIIDGYGT